MIEEIIRALHRLNKETFTKQEIEYFLKQKMEEMKNETIELDNMTLLPMSYEVVIGDSKYVMPRKEFKVLHYLITNPNKCVTRDAILRNCWEDGVIVGNRTVDVHICKIKRRLKSKLSIYTHKGVGYKWKLNEV